MSLIMFISSRRVINSGLFKHSVYVSTGLCDISSKCCTYLNECNVLNSHSVNKNSLRFFSKKNSSVVPHKTGSEIQTEVKFSVKETTKTVSYLSVIVLGVGLTAVFFYAIFRELFSSNSPSGIYSKAFYKCCNDTRVQDALGTPIKGYGEENRLGRRRHVSVTQYFSHAKYLKDNVPHLRMVFYLKGSRNKATVYLDMSEDSKGNYDFRYLFVQVHDLAGKVIVLEDNRLVTDSTGPKTFDFEELKAL